MSRIISLRDRSRRLMGQVHNEIEGFVFWELIDAKTGIIKRQGGGKNLITDAMLDAIGSSSSIRPGSMSHCAVGTDNTTPAVSDTSLGAELARTSNSGGNSDTRSAGPSHAYWQMTRVRLFEEAEANGNLTEVGFFNASSGGTMFNRQLFLDGGGSPTAISKTSDEQLRITFIWRVYTNTTVNSEVKTIDGVSTDCDTRAYDVDNSQAWSTANGMVALLGYWNEVSKARAFEANTMPTTGAAQSGTGASASSGSALAYVAGDFYRDIELVWEPAVANFVTGIGSIAWMTVNGFDAGAETQITTFDPKVGKEDTDRFTFTGRFSWARR